MLCFSLLQRNCNLQLLLQLNRQLLLLLPPKIVARFAWVPA
jgi:hypothetical protein